MPESSLLIAPKPASDGRTEINGLVKLLKQLPDDDDARSLIMEYMRRRKKRHRKKKKSSPDCRRPRNQHSATLGQSIASFCKEEGIGRSTFYVWEKRGIAPEVLRPAGPRGWARITPEAKDRWKTRFTTQAQPVEAAE